MDALRQLESGVNQLLARLEDLSQENKRLHAESELRSTKIKGLEQEIARLRKALNSEVEFRRKVCIRVEVLLGELEQYTCQRS